MQRRTSKRIIKIALALLLIFSVICLSSCEAIQKWAEGDEKAANCLDEFCAALSAGDYDTAYSKTHPDAFKTKDDLISMITDIENEYNVDFSLGVSLREYYDLGMLFYDSECGGSAHMLAYTSRIGKIEANIYATVVDSKTGYGIYEFEIELYSMPEFKI